MTRQGGYILPLLLGLLFVGGLMFHFDAQRIEHGLERARIERTRAALAEAREALIAHAMTYDITHPDMPRIGALPCPDRDGDGSADAPCGAQDALSVGRFPYRTLALPRLLDGSGNCLWYAVAGPLKNGPHSSQPLNWDSPGQFDVFGTSGNAIAVTPLTRAIGVLIAPGTPLPGQDRAASGQFCPGGDDATADRAAFIESLAIGALDAVASVREGVLTGPSLNNDAIAWIDIDEVFERARRAPHFSTFLQQRIAVAADALASLPFEEIVGATQSPDGTLQLSLAPDASALGIWNGPTGDQDSLSDLEKKARALGRNHDDWRSMLRLLACKPVNVGEPAPQCLRLNGLPCSALLLAGGARTVQQTRQSDELAEYFEEPLLSQLSAFATSYEGDGTWDPAQPSQDLISCIP